MKENIEEKEFRETDYKDFSDRESEGFKIISNRFEKVKVGGIFQQHEELVEIRKYRRDITPLKLNLNLEIIIPKYKVLQGKMERYEISEEVQDALNTALYLKRKEINENKTA